MVLCATGRQPLRRRGAWPRTALAARALGLAALVVAVFSPLAGPTAKAQSAPSSVPVLIYHHIDETLGLYGVTSQELDAQLSWLANAGYTTITPSQLYWGMYQGGTLPANPVILSIDDGWPSAQTFIDMVNRYGMTAAFMLPNYAAFSPDQIVAMSQMGEVCGHTVDHAHLDWMPYDQQYAEVHDNKVWLEGIIGKPVTCFAYPFGGYNDSAIQAVKDSGYLMAFLCSWAPIPLDGTANPYLLQRINVDGAYGVSDLAHAMGNWTV